MKTRLLTIIAICLSSTSMWGGDKMIFATRAEPFAMTGFIVGYEGGNCLPPKFAYEFISTDHRTKIWLCAVDSNQAALHRAMLDRGIYCVRGTLQQGTEREYVEVESVRWYYSSI